MSSTNQPPTKRPKLVWAILIYFLVSSVFTLISTVLIYSDSIAITPEQAKYFGSQTIINYIPTVVIGGLNLFGAFALFFLRKIAVYFFSASFIIIILLTTVEMTNKDFQSALGGGGTIGMFIGYAILLAILAYSWRLKNRGILI